MNHRTFKLFSALLLAGLVAAACSFTTSAPTPTAAPQATLQTAPTLAPTTAPTPTATPAAAGVTGGTAQAQESGPKIVTGSVTYTNTFFTSGVAEPEIILEDEGGFVTRNRKFVIPIQSQVIGEITSDFYTSPFTYSLSLPAEPNPDSGFFGSLFGGSDSSSSGDKADKAKAPAGDSKPAASTSSSD